MSSLRSMIPCIPEPNHLRLIHDCYPKSKSAVEPDSNALGKLTFYTKSRPVKLDKVGKALLRQSQKHGESTAALCVTLSIVKKLLDEGRKDVSVFGAEAMAIIDVALQRAKAGGGSGSGSGSTATDPHGTLELYEKTAGAFHALATFSQAAAIDEGQYLRLLAQFSQLAREEKSIQLRLIGLHALDGVVQSDLFHSADFPAQSDLVMSALLFDVLEGKGDVPEVDEASDKEEGTRSQGKKAETSSQYARPALHDRRARSIRIAKGLEGTEKPPSSSDAAKAALKIIRTVFRLSQPRHIDIVLGDIVTFFDKHNRGNAWTKAGQAGSVSSHLAGKFMEWTPAQYRFAVVQFWLDQLLSIDGNGNSVADTGASGAGDLRWDATIDILVHLLSSPDTAVVNLALSDVLETLSGLLARNPDRPGVQRAILALSSHIYYPEQINDLIGDLLSDVIDRHAAGQASPQSLVALLDSVRGIATSAGQASGEGVSNKKQKGLARTLSLEQVPASLVLLDDPNPAVRIAYLRTLRAIVHAAASSSSTHPALAENEKEPPQTAKTVPSITFSNSTRGGIPLYHSPDARFAKELQIRVYGLLERDHAQLQEEEVRALNEVLQAIYSKADGQVVLEGVPVLLAFRQVATPDASPEKREAVSQLLSAASRELCSTWGVPLVNDPQTFLHRLAASSDLQAATHLSEQTLYDKLSHPYTHASGAGTSPTSAMETLNSPKRAVSVRSSRHSGANGLAGGAGSGREGSLRGHNSALTTSLADLRLSLGGSGGAHDGIKTGRSSLNGTHSPGRSTVDEVGDRSIASSYVAGSTPPNGFSHANGSPRMGGHSPNKQLSLKDGTSSIGSPNKRRLDRIVGTLDEHRLSHEVPNPPYQLS